MGKATTFLSTPSARRATQPYVPQAGQNPISIHALREEGDNKDGTMTIMASKFLSTPSARRATDCKRGQRTFHPISIHALREEGDRSGGRGNQNCRDFYPRPPRGGRPDPKGVCMSDELFLSTPSARRATLYAMHSTCAPMDFYPRPPRGGRLGGRTFYDVTGGFLSTPSARRATLPHRDRRGRHPISIHALREEGDHSGLPNNRPDFHFYPRPPRGGRP